MMASRTILLIAFAAFGCAAAAQEPAVYTIDAAQSDVHWKVYSAGAFARLGHNHVISAGEIEGSVARHAELAESRFELTIPAAGLVVDDPALRGRYGEDFSSEPSPEGIAGTRRNMLGEQVLDAEDHPALRIHGRISSGPLDAATIVMTVELLGRRVELAVPGSIAIEGDAIVASGEFRITHADLGMKPFRVMMGALAVAEPIDFSYRLHAVRTH